MPLSVVPTTVNEPNDPTGATPETVKPAPRPENGRPDGSGSVAKSPRSFDPEPDSDGDQPDKDRERAKSPVVRGSRWIDYDTYELLEMISELEDERRWARLREGVWIAI